MPKSSTVVIASFDVPTKGRASLTYYNEYEGSDFYDRLENWFLSCCWYRWRGSQVRSPSLKEIVNCAFGKEVDKFIQVDGDFSKEQYQRLFTCIVDKAVIPADIVMSLYTKASAPLAYNNSNRELLYFVACAIIRKYHNDILKKEEWTLMLQEDKKDRSYQFGRLLAVFEKIERDTYDTENKYDRDPNAIRLWSAYREQPFHFTEILHRAVQPYFAKLNPKFKCKYQALLESIMVKIGEFPENELNRSLGDVYLLGYYCQRNYLYAKNGVDVSSVDEEMEE